jgi:hypothetical protein
MPYIYARRISSCTLRLLLASNAFVSSAVLGLWGVGFTVVSRTSLRVQHLGDKPQQCLQRVKRCRLSGNDVFHRASELPARDVGARIELHNKRPMHGQVERLVV